MSRPGFQAPTRNLALLTAVLAPLAACGDSGAPTAPDPDPEPDRPTFLQIVTVTDGLVLDPDGYTVTVDEAVETLGINDQRIVEVNPGLRTLTLSGQAANCTPHGQPVVNARSVKGDTLTVEFALTCFRDPIAFGHIVDQSAGWQVFVIDASGGPAVELTSAPGLDNNFLTEAGAAFNPARTHVVIQTNDERDGLTAYDVAVIALNKSETFRHTREGTEFQPAWAPDGSSILFHGFGPGGVYEIFTASPDLSTVTSITPGSTGWLSRPVFSPDGTRIAYQREADIYVMNVDGSGAVNVSDPGGARPEGTRDLLGGWSHDGARILFKRWSEPVDEADLRVVDADGSNPQVLTDEVASGSQAAFGPDGRVYYTRCTDAFCETKDAWVMNADGTDATALTTSGMEAFSGTFNATATFDGAESPGAALITVQNPLAENGALYIMAPDGSGKTPLFNGFVDYVRWN